MFARKNGKVEVVEYSELDPKEAAATFDSEPLSMTLLLPLHGWHEGVCRTSAGSDVVGAQPVSRGGGRR